MTFIIVISACACTPIKVQFDISRTYFTWMSCHVAQMLLTKTLLTEVLLEVTNEEIVRVALETHRKASKGLSPLLFCPFCRACQFSNFSQFLSNAVSHSVLRIV